MKKKILILCLGLLLTSCGNNLSNNETTSSSNTDVSYLTSSSNTHNSSNNMNLSSSSINKEEKVGLKDYSYHPMSEPSINKQLVTFNPMGDLKNVWDYYRGDNVTVAVIDSGFDYDHPEFFDINGKSRVSDKSAYIYTTSSKQIKVEVGTEQLQALIENLSAQLEKIQATLDAILKDVSMGFGMVDAYNKSFEAKWNKSLNMMLNLL